MNKNIFIIILISMTSMFTHAVSLKELNESIKNTDNSIQITKKKMKEIKERCKLKFINYNFIIYF